MRIVVGMSGGVDSSVAALLLKREGHDVIGVFMNNWDEQDPNGVCTAENDWRDLRRVCDMIDIPYYSVNFAEDYWNRVFALFLEEYRAGRTPNPDVLCNREIKFRSFLEYADSLMADKMATGHFVRTNADGDLLKGTDSNKDQSYFLYMLKAVQLQKSLFPVGQLTKTRVREIAAQAGLPVSQKKDSTGICFIGERKFKQFLKNYLPAQPGDITLGDGTVVGKHDGLMYYTIGQRRGLGIGGGGDGRRYFVIDKDLTGNRLIVAQGEDDPRLYSRECSCDQVTFVRSALPVNTPCRVMAKVRYRQPDQACTAVLDDAGGLHLSFEQPQRAITPGQSAVVYDGDRCLGGGIII